MRINREKLLGSLESIRPGLSQREILEQSSCIVFLDGFACTYDDEVSCRAPTGLDESFRGAVKAESLLKLLHELPEDEVDVNFSDTEMTVKGKGRKGFYGVEKDIVLPVDQVDFPEQWRTLPDDFCEAIGTVGRCASSDESRFNLTCLHIAPKWVEASDEYQVCRWRTQTGFPEPVLLRQSSVRHIATLGMTESGETKSWVHFRNASGLILSCRRYVEDYPELRHYLKPGGDPLVLPKGLIEAAGRADIFSSENGDDNVVEVSIKSGHLQIVGRGASGRYEEKKKLAYDGQPVRFCIPPQLLADTVKRHNECSIQSNRLYIDGGSYVYVSALFAPDANGEAHGEGESEGE
jgi:hypothetical protein